MRCICIRCLTSCPASVTTITVAASSHELDQFRLDGVRINVAGFTHLSRDHLDHHADMDSYFAAEARLFTEILSDGGIAVINIDCPWGRRLVEMIADRAVHIITCGHAEDADIRIIDVTSHAVGMSVTAEADGMKYILPLALNGTFQADNAILAAAMARTAGWRLITPCCHCPICSQHRGGYAIHGHPRGGVAVIDYAHTPDALATALASLRPGTEGQLGVVFGCGGDRDKGKRNEMGEVAARLADFTIITDDNPRGEDPAVIRSTIAAAVRCRRYRQPPWLAGGSTG